MHSKTHFIQKACGANERYISKGDNVNVGGGVADAYHIYGAWWEDANNIHFYLDEQYAYTVNVDYTAATDKDEDGVYEIRSKANDHNLAACHWAGWQAVDVVPDKYRDQKWIIRHLGDGVYELKL